ncbi:MAG TPA: hypothetical protein VLK03_05205 [Nocardioides sp.]|nr:hypothetical protein [Nocardioides sp.]
MKRILAATAVAALALVGTAGTAGAAPSNAQCFGQIHKQINTESLLGLDNVGQAVKAFGGPGKNAVATGACAG